MANRRTIRGFTLLELAISLAIIVMLMAVLVPALSSARVSSQRSQCATNQVAIGKAWTNYLTDHDQQFPYVALQPAWRYGGVRFSPITKKPFLDTERPLNQYLPQHRNHGSQCDVFECPGDHGITDADGKIGTASRTAFHSYGTSYRANALLLNAKLAGVDDRQRGVDLSEIIPMASRMVLMGDPVWYEQSEQTQRLASWHGEDGMGNILFLNLSVRFMRVAPRTKAGPVMIDPVPTDRVVDGT
jgi:prepilin-type N-terminal cleavage/methylation domain-containing protein